jgi:hypothetical protein
VQHARQRQVIDVLRVPGDFRAAFLARDGLSDETRGHPDRILAPEIEDDLCHEGAEANEAHERSLASQAPLTWRPPSAAEPGTAEQPGQRRDDARAEHFETPSVMPYFMTVIRVMPFIP